MKNLSVFKREMNKLRGIYDYSKSSFGGKKSKKYLELIRELVFVRYISAFEVFLIENVREIFTLTKEPFSLYQGTPKLLNSANILSAKSLSQLHSIIIKNICKNLSSGGLKEIRIFYNKYFNTEFSVLSPSAFLNIEKYHNDRHILVHRLGIVDKDYRRKYQTEIKKIVITEKYLAESFKDFKEFAMSLSSKLDEDLSILNTEENIKLEREMKVVIIDIEETSEIVRRKYRFWANEELIDMNDLILEYSKLSKGLIEIVFGGSLGEVRGVIKKLKSDKKRGTLDYRIIKDSIHVRNPFKAKKTNLTLEAINKIREKLPPQPWPRGIHKKIAEEVGLSNNKVSGAIQHLIKNKFFKDQIDGKIIE